MAAAALWLLRRRRGSAAVLLAVALVTAAPAKAEQPEQLRLLFAGVSCSSAKMKNQSIALEEFIQTEMVKFKVYNVVSARDVQSLMGIERQKQLMGCNEDSQCFSEIGGALNAKRALTASLTYLGQSYLLNLTLLDTASGKPLGRVGRRIKEAQGLENGLDEIEPMLRELVQQDSAVTLHSDAPTVVAAAPVEPTSTTPNEFTLGVRGEFEALGTAFAPAVTGTFTKGLWGLAVAAIVMPNPGFRVEGRVLPFDWSVKPYVGVGATAMIPAVAARGVLGATTRVGPLAISADVAVEYAFVVPSEYEPLAVLASAGVAWVF